MAAIYGQWRHLSGGGGDAQEYLLIAQHTPHVEQFVRQAEHQWLFTEYIDLDQAFEIQSVGLSLALADLYEAVQF